MFLTHGIKVYQRSQMVNRPGLKSAEKGVSKGLTATQHELKIFLGARCGYDRLSIQPVGLIRTDKVKSFWYEWPVSQLLALREESRRRTYMRIY